MPTSGSGSASAAEADLPRPVTAALEEIETDVPTVTPTDDATRRALDDEVEQYLAQHVRDPIPRLLLSRPKIFKWCLDQVLDPTPPRSRPDAARVADPLPTGDTGDRWPVTEPEPATTSAPATERAPAPEQEPVIRDVPAAPAPPAEHEPTTDPAPERPANEQEPSAAPAPESKPSTGGRTRRSGKESTS